MNARKITALPNVRDNIIYAQFQPGKRGQSFKDAPFDEQLERAVLAGVVLRPDILPIIRAALPESQMFFFLRYACIYNAMCILEDRGDKIDYLTLSNELKMQGWLDDIGGLPELTAIVNEDINMHHVEMYAAIVYRAYLRRELMKQADMQKVLAADGSLSIEEICEKSESTLLKITSMGITRTEQTAMEAAGAALDMFNERRESNTTPYYPTGFIDLDKRISGLECGKYHVVLARTGVGKSLFVIQLAFQLAQQGYRVMFNSNELTTEDIVLRMIAMQARVNTKKLRTGEVTDLEAKAVTEASAYVSKLPILFDYCKPLTPLELAGKYERAKRKYGGIDAVFVDGIYKMRYPGVADNNKVLEFEEISERFTEFANEWKIPIMVTHQAKPEVDSRQNKRPQLGDSRWCDKIAQDAGVLMALYREGKYNPLAMDANITEVIVLKGRDNTEGTSKLMFLEDAPRFANVETRSLAQGKGE